MYNGANDDGEKRWWESFVGWITLNRAGYLSVTVHHWVNWHEKIMKNHAIYHLHHSPPASKYHAGWTNSPAGTVGVHLLWKPELDSSQTFQLTLWHTSWHFPCECCTAKMMYDRECVHTSSPLCITEYIWRRMLENTCIHFSRFFSSASPCSQHHSCKSTHGWCSPKLCFCWSVASQWSKSGEGRPACGVASHQVETTAAVTG